MTPRRKRLYDKAIREKRIRFEGGKWWVLCKWHTADKGHNMYRRVKTTGGSIVDKEQSVEDRCMDALRLGIKNCTGNCRERLR